MLIKDAWGGIHHIKGSNGGFYFPSSIQTLTKTDGDGGESGLFQINFQYSQETPIPKDTLDGDNTITKTAPLSIPYELIGVQFPPTEADANIQCYSKTLTLAQNETHKETYLYPDAIVTDNPTDADTYNGEAIEPVVYYYLSSGERIIFPSDYTVSDTKTISITVDNKTQTATKRTKFQVKNPSKMTIKCEVR